MKRNPFLAAVVVSGLVAQPGMVVSAGAQDAPPAGQAGVDVPTFSVGTSAVTLDIVVRDKKGNAVRDLKAGEFEVFEEGARQSIDSFKVYGRPMEPAEEKKGAAVAAPAPLPAADESENRPQVIAFVFDRLAATARDLARKAAVTYLDKGHVDGDLVGVFSIDLALHTVQPFTRETGLIRAGLERAASQANTQFSADRARTSELVQGVTTAQQATDSVSGAAPTGPGAGAQAQILGATAGSAAVAQAVASAQVSMLRSFESLERDQQGLATSNALLAVVSGLKNLPGRKTVVFFSEGLVIPANVQDQFRSVIHTANRANVSIYTMDAGGLRAESMGRDTRNEMMQALDRRRRQLESGRDDAPDGSMTKAMERNEDLLRLNPEAGMSQLANETGGFMIRDTNDAASAFRRMEEDMRFHYLVAYSPSNENYDGRFRTISVKVTRPGVQVQTRQGYYAIRAVESTPIKTFEAPALAQLDKSPRPHSFAIETLGLSFPEPKRPGLVPVMVHVPGNTIAYVLDKDDKSGKKIHRADFAVVVRIRNEAKQEVDRLSQRYVLSVPEANLTAARAGDLLFYREAELGPGHYTLDAVGYDAMVQKASVQTAVLEVQKSEADRVRVSSIFVVARAEKVARSDENAKNPLFFGETILYPNMGEPVRKAAAPAVGFYFTVYGAKDKAAPKKATIEIYQGEQAAGKVIADLPAPDANGRIQYAGALPLQGFTPGPYKIKVTAADATGFDSRQTSFTVTE